MTLEYLRSLTDNELLELSLEKNRKENYTTNANKAMKVRRERSGHWEGVSSRAPSFEAMLIAEEGRNGFIKKFK